MKNFKAIEFLVPMYHDIERGVMVFGLDKELETIGTNSLERLEESLDAYEPDDLMDAIRIGIFLGKLHKDEIKEIKIFVDE